MAEQPEQITIELPSPQPDPLIAYAKLRSYTPGRPSFLLESLTTDGGQGRYSIVGYRVRSGEMSPPGVPAIDDLCEELATPLPASFIEAVGRAKVGYFGYGNTHTIHGIRLWEGEGAAAKLLVGATVLVFDHREGRVTVVGPKKGRVAERCAWELEHGPEIPALGATEPGAEPEGLKAVLDDDRLAAKLTRTQRFLAEPLSEVVLAQVFQAPQRDADAFDAYRALRELRPGRMGLFIDFGQSPVMPPMQLAGTTDVCLLAHRRDDPEGCSVERLSAALRQAFPHPSLVGQPVADAAQLVRRMDELPRETFGAAVGYGCPGGEACYALGDCVITAEEGLFETRAPLAITADSTPEQAKAVARQAASGPLAAIRAAQDAAARRQAEGGGEPEGTS